MRVSGQTAMVFAVLLVGCVEGTDPGVFPSPLSDESAAFAVLSEWPSEPHPATETAVAATSDRDLVRVEVIGYVETYYADVELTLLLDSPAAGDVLDVRGHRASADLRVEYGYPSGADSIVCEMGQRSSTGTIHVEEPEPGWLALTWDRLSFDAECDLAVVDGEVVVAR